jgi:nucleoside-diphosphate-sugar epimerase
MDRKHTLLITGGAGYVGAMLIDLFSRRPDVERIVAVDKEPLPDFIKDAPNLTYIEANISDGTWQARAAEAKPDIVIHTAWQIREMYGKKPLQWKWNVDGSDAVFDFAFNTASVKKLIHFSTVASYGAFPSNTIEHRFLETESFRKTDYLYAEEKRISEEHLKERHEKARKAGSKVQVAVIRPAAITGPRGRYMRVRFGLQATLSGQLKSSESFIHRLVSAMVSFVPITPKWCRQFIHEDDIADVVELLAFGPLKGDYEAFNACPPGPVVTGTDMAQAVGKRTVRIHPYLIRLAFFAMWHASRGKVPTSKGGWKSYSYPIALNGSKLTLLYGFGYRWQSKDAFVKKEGRYMKYVQ